MLPKLKLDSNRAEMWPEMLISAAGTVLGPNTDSLRSDLLLKRYEIFSVAPGLSHEPNASNKTRNGLWTKIVLLLLS